MQEDDHKVLADVGNNPGSKGSQKGGARNTKKSLLFAEESVQDAEVLTGTAEANRMQVEVGVAELICGWLTDVPSLRNNKFVVVSLSGVLSLIWKCADNLIGHNCKAIITQYNQWQGSYSMKPLLCTMLNTHCCTLSDQGSS